MKIWTDSLTYFDNAEAFEFDRLLELLHEVGNIEQGIQLERSLWRRRLELADYHSIALAAQLYMEQARRLGMLEIAFTGGYSAGYLQGKAAGGAA